MHQGDSPSITDTNVPRSGASCKFCLIGISQFNSIPVQIVILMCCTESSYILLIFNSWTGWTGTVSLVYPVNTLAWTPSFDLDWSYFSLAVWLIIVILVYLCYYILLFCSIWTKCFLLLCLLHFCLLNCPLISWKRTNACVSLLNVMPTGKLWIDKNFIFPWKFTKRNALLE